MPEKESSGMLEKVKRGIKMISPFEFKTEAGKNPIAGMNLPVRLARSDCAYENLTVLFKSRFFMLNDSLRAAYYDLSLRLIDVVLSNLTYIQNESNGKSAEDPCLPTLMTIRKILEVLKISAETSLKMATCERGIESFGGPLAIAKIRLVDDSIGDMEISLLHSVSELFDILSLPMQRNSDLRRKLLVKEEQERYSRSFQEFNEYYSSLCRVES